MQPLPADLPYAIDLLLLRFEIRPHQNLAYKPNGEKMNPRKHENRRKQRHWPVFAENMGTLQEFSVA
jgi:hypothetical protein